MLADHCYQCHGPDEKQRKAKLRLDTKDGLFAKHEDAIPVVPSRLDQSELIRRITSKNDNERMPPADKGKKLSDAQIALVKLWVEQGSLQGSLGLYRADSARLAESAAFQVGSAQCHRPIHPRQAGARGVVAIA